MDLERLAKLVDEMFDSLLWFDQYGMPLDRVASFFPDRVPDVSTPHGVWWILEDGTIVGKATQWVSYPEGLNNPEDATRIGFIIPPGTEDPPNFSLRLVPDESFEPKDTEGGEDDD